MAAGRARRIVRKTLRWTLRVVLLLLVLVLVVVVLLLYSPGFLHVVLNVGLGFYNNRIPGEIRIGRVEGRLADRLVLGDIYLADADGHVLVAARELSLRWTPWDLLHKGVTVEQLSLSDAQIHLVKGAGFGDLAIPGPSRPRRKTVAPDLPLDIRVAKLEIEGVDLYKHTGETIVGELRLSARDLAWKGLVAHLKIDDAAAKLPGVTLEALALEADYQEPHLGLTGLITTDMAVAELVRVDLDADDITGEALLAVDGRRGAIAARLKGPLAEKIANAPGDPSVRIDASGKAGHLEVGVQALVPGVGGVELSASGNPIGAPHFDLRGRIDADLAGLLPPSLADKLGYVRPTFEARVTGPDWQQLSAELRLSCVDCGAASGLDLRALARRDAILGDASAFAQLVGAGMALTAEVQAGPLGPEAGRWDLRIPDIAVPLGVARLFVDLPPIDGSLATRGSCTGAPLRCEGFVDVGDFRGYNARVQTLQAQLHGEPLAPIPVAHAALSIRGLAVPNYHFAGAEITADVGPSKDVPIDGEHPHGALEAAIGAEAWVRGRDRGDRAKIAARVRPGPPLTILLDALDVHMRGLQALLPRPARVEIAGRRIDIKGLRLLAAGGEIGVDGRADLDGRSDLKATIDRVKLAPLAGLVPTLRGQVGGTVTARISLQGPAQAPELSVQLGGQKLRFREDVIGDLDLGVNVARGKGRAAIALTGPMAERFAIAAEVPLTADLSRGKFGTRQGGLHFAVDIKNFRLASLRPWIKGTLAPQGDIDVQVAVDGPASKPDTKISVRGRHLVVGKEAPASFDLDFEQKAGADATARIDIVRLGGRLRINAPLLPLRVNLVDGGVKWRPEAQHEVTIVAREIDLWRQISAFKPGHDFAGRIELEGKLSGPMTDPRLQLAVMGDNLRFRDGLIGKLRLDTHLEDQRAIIDLKVNGDVAKQISMHAEAPLLVDLAKGKVGWLKDQPHLLDAQIRGIDLAGLKQLGLTAAWEGRVDVTAKLRGSATVPEFNVHTDLTEIVWKTRRVGTVHADVDYAEKQVKVGVDAQLGRGTIKVRGTAPVAMNLGHGEVKWDENGQHDVEIRVDQLDRTMLAPLGRVPEEALLELSMIARAKGNLADFAASLEAHGQMGHKLIGGAPVHITADILPKSQELKFSVGPHKWAGEIKVAVNSKADILALVRKTAKADDIKFTASMRAPRFDTRFAQAFVPRDLYDVNGELKASIDATGTIGAPLVRGDLHVRRGSISVLQMQQRIRKIDFDVKADGRTIILENLTAESGKGRATASARVELPVGGGMKMTAETKLNKFPLVRPGLPQMQIDTHVKADMTSSLEETDIKLRIGGTKVYVTGYTVDPPKQIPESLSVRFKDEKERIAVATDEGPDGEVSAENEVEAPKDGEPKLAKRFAIDIKLTDPVDIRGPGTEMKWQGAVAATRDGLQRHVTGKLTAKEGRLDLLGNRFKIQSGQVTLPEDEDTVDPFINVVATTSTVVAEVTATFKGRITRPSLIFSSEPAMSQSQILTLLLTGSPDASEADESRVLAQAAALLATFQNPALSSFLSSRLGIDHVGLSFGDDVNQPILSVGKNLTKNIYVETAYKVNADPRRSNKVEARVEYQFAPRWSVETFFGDAAVGGLDVFWRKIFGQPKRLKENEGKSKPKGTGVGDSPRGGKAADAPTGGGSGGGSAGGGAH